MRTPSSPEGAGSNMAFSPTRLGEAEALAAQALAQRVASA